MARLPLSIANSYYESCYKSQNEVQKTHSPDMRLILDEELHEIRRIWHSEEGDWEDVLPQIYKAITGESLDWVIDDTNLFSQEDGLILENICADHDLPPAFVKQLLGIEQDLLGLRRRHELYSRIDKTFNRDWRTNEQVITDIEPLLNSTDEKETVTVQQSSYDL